MEWKEAIWDRFVTGGHDPASRPSSNTAIASFAHEAGSGTGHNPKAKAMAKWRKLATVDNLKAGPKAPHSTTLTYNGILRADQPCNCNTAWWRPMRFDMICEANDIEHRLAKSNPLWTNGQIERMNRTIKEATVKRFHYDSHDQLRMRLADFIAAYNFARRHKTLKGLTPYEYIAKIWTSEPERFIVNRIHRMPALNT